MIFEKETPSRYFPRLRPMRQGSLAARNFFLHNGIRDWAIQDLNPRLPACRAVILRPRPESRVTNHRDYRSIRVFRNASQWPHVHLMESSTPSGNSLFRSGGRETLGRRPFPVPYKPKSRIQNCLTSAVPSNTANCKKLCRQKRFRFLAGFCPRRMPPELSPLYSRGFTSGVTRPPFSKARMHKIAGFTEALIAFISFQKAPFVRPPMSQRKLYQNMTVMEFFRAI